MRRHAGAKYVPQPTNGRGAAHPGLRVLWMDGDVYGWDSKAGFPGAAHPLWRTELAKLGMYFPFLILNL